MTTSNDTQALFKQLNLETARIQWHELERFFAAGQLIAVNPELDLIATAVAIAEDDKTTVAAWLDSGQLAGVSDAQAQAWHTDNATLWAVVIKPWILVQHRQPNQ